MKEKVFYIVAIIFSLSAHAQIYTPAGSIQGVSVNDNIGIGTQTPIAKLSVQAGPNGYPTPLKAISIWGPNSPANANSAQDLSWDFAAAGSAVIRSFRGSDYDTYLQFMTNSQHGGNSPQVQMHINQNGYVGIGTVSPSQKLEVNGSGIFQGAVISSISDDGGGHIQLQNPSKTATGLASTWKIFNMAGVYGNSLQFWAYDNLGCAGGLCNNRFTIMDNGNVGIGIPNPLHKLDIDGTIHSKNAKFESNIDIFSAHFSGNNLNNGVAVGTSTENTGVIQGYSKSFTTINNIALQAYGGNVGIGTTTPNNKLDVNGTIHSKEVKVDLNFPAPDYVFTSDYDLKSLEEVENYIKENSHLPEIPSAKEFEKNGINVSEMNMALLKKIEELTLYVIEQERKNNIQLRKIEELEKQNKYIKLLSERIDKLENQHKK